MRLRSLRNDGGRGGGPAGAAGAIGAGDRYFLGTRCRLNGGARFSAKFAKQKFSVFVGVLGALATLALNERRMMTHSYLARTN